MEALKKPLKFIYTLESGQNLALNMFETIFFNILRHNLLDYSCILFKQITCLIQKVM